jgi:hypothetical protein
MTHKDKAKVQIFLAAYLKAVRDGWAHAEALKIAQGTVALGEEIENLVTLCEQEPQEDFFTEHFRKQYAEKGGV